MLFAWGEEKGAHVAITLHVVQAATWGEERAVAFAPGAESGRGNTAHTIQ